MDMGLKIYQIKDEIYVTYGNSYILAINKDDMNCNKYTKSLDVMFQILSDDFNVRVFYSNAIGGYCKYILAVDVGNIVILEKIFDSGLGSKNMKIIKDHDTKNSCFNYINSVKC